MAKHHPDLIMCRKQPGIAIGRLCLKCDGKCPICDSYVRPQTLVRTCDECNYGSFQGRCVICGGKGVSDAYYCEECTRLEKDRDGCPKIINLGTAKTDLFYERKSDAAHTSACRAVTHLWPSQVDRSPVELMCCCTVRVYVQEVQLQEEVSFDLRTAAMRLQSLIEAAQTAAVRSCKAGIAVGPFTTDLISLHSPLVILSGETVCARQ